MENENNPSEPISQDVNVASGEGMENVSKDKNIEAKTNPSQSDETLKNINEKTGRNYKSLEEAIKGIGETYKYVGKAHKLDEGEKPVVKAEEAIEDRVDNLEDELKTERFLKNHPEAQSVVNLIRAKADHNEISFEKAYTEPVGDEKYSLKDLLSSKLESEKAKIEEQSIGVNSKSRITQGESAEIGQLIDKVQKADSFDAKQALVEKVLKLSK